MATQNDYPAHIRIGASGEEYIQSVTEHCKNVASYASNAIGSVGLAISAYLLGITHDMGKEQLAFADYIKRAAHGLPVRRGSVNHTFAAVRFLLTRYRTENGSYADVATELLSLVAGSHHGWFDCVNEQKKSGFVHRLTQEDIHYDEAMGNYLVLCVNEAILDDLWNRAVSELTTVLERIQNELIPADASDERYETECTFYTGMLARLLLSALIDADRRDTAEFMHNTPFMPKRDKDEMRAIWCDCLQRVEQRLDTLSRNTQINRVRRIISDQCKRSILSSGQVFRLNTPTGSGKTLTLLRSVLYRAARDGNKRIVFTAPLLSILDQNARVIREYVQDDSLILEHHSNLVQTDASSEDLDIRELLTETWDAPIIITTLVQLLNTLFSGKTTSIRRFQALCDSIIVIDEVQTVPTNMLSMFSLAVNFLSSICNATVILCSATQPCIERIEHPLCIDSDLVPFDPTLWNVFKRTELVDCGSRTLPEIAALAKHELETSDSLLIVCNKISEVAALYEALRDYGGRIFCLSAAMCIAHRDNTLKEVHLSLAAPHEKTLCISTQVVEAGVDISFQRLIRLTAGMDSVVQAAGRCNRNGEAGVGKTSPVFVVQCLGESLGRLPEIQAGKDATIATLAEYRLHPERFHNTPDSDEAIRSYYQTLYQRMPRGKRDYPIKNKPYTMLSLLSRNEYSECDDAASASYFFRQAFRLAGSEFEVFSQDTTDVIVPYKDGSEIIADLNSAQAAYDLKYVKALLDKAKPYCVSLYRYQRDALVQSHALHEVNGVWTLTGHYDDVMGFSMSGGQANLLLEV